MAILATSVEIPYRLVALQRNFEKSLVVRDNALHLGKYDRRLEELHCQFIENLNHTTEGAQRHFRRSLRAWDAVIMAFSGEDVVGYATVERSSEDTMELSALFVEASYRRRGISKDLVRGAEHMARRMGADYLQMIVAGEGVHGDYVSREGYTAYPGGWKFVRKPLEINKASSI